MDHFNVITQVRLSLGCLKSKFFSACKKTGSILKKANIWCSIFGNAGIQVGFKATHRAKHPIFLNLLIYLNYLLFPNDIVSLLTDTI